MRIDHALLTPWYFHRTAYSMPPAPIAPTEENAASQAAAEAAAQKEKENLKKNRRPTLLTSYSGVSGKPSLSSASLSGNAKLGQ